MAGVNKVILMGRLGRDPELKYLLDGTAAVAFSIATSEKFKRSNGEAAEETQWHRIVAYRKTAEIIAEYFHKGSNIFVEGKIKSRKYTTSGGEEKEVFEIVVDKIDFPESQANRANGANSQAAAKAPPPRQVKTAPQQQPQQQGSTDDYDDDIPF